VVRAHSAVPTISAFIEPLTAPGTRSLSGWGTRGGRKRVAHRAAKSGVATEPAAKNFAANLVPARRRRMPKRNDAPSLPAAMVGR